MGTVFVTESELEHWILVVTRVHCDPAAVNDGVT